MLVGTVPINHALSAALDLLSQGETLQLHCGTFGYWNQLWKLHFNLWFIFTHHTYGKKMYKKENVECERGKKRENFNYTEATESILTCKYRAGWMTVARGWMRVGVGVGLG